MMILKYEKNSKKLDWEVELGIIIGKEVKKYRRESDACRIIY